VSWDADGFPGEGSVVVGQVVLARRAALRERRIDGEGRARQRPSMARRHYLRAPPGRRIRSAQSPGRLAAVCRGRLSASSGKAELFSEALAAQGLDPLPAPDDIAAAPGLQLISGKTLHYLNSSYGHIERHRRRDGEPPIEIHADDALERGLRTGDAVLVTSPRGSVEAACRISDRVARGVVWMPFGRLYDAAGARKSVNALTAEEPTVGWWQRALRHVRRG
jgi:anaerobic selenocysteine-containing dehydrogenase